MAFSNPVVGGSTLVRNAIQSQDYVTGVSGWAIFRTGAAEFNNVTVRGNVIAGGGTVTLDSTGLRVASTLNTSEFLVNRSAGFVARNVPDNGGIALMTVGQALFTPTTGNTGPNGGVWTTNARLISLTATLGAEDLPQMFVTSGAINSQAVSQIVLSGAGQGGVSKSFIQVTADTVQIDHKMLNGDTSMFYVPMQAFTVNIAVLATDTNVGLGATNYPLAFPAGRGVFGIANINSSAGATALWYVRFIPVSNTQYNLTVSRPATGAASTLTIQVIAFVIPA